MSTKKAKKHKGLSIRPRRNGWQVDFGTRYEGNVGTRTQRSFKTLDEAKLAIDAHVETLRVRADDERVNRMSIYDMTNAERMDWRKARDLLDRAHTLTEAVEFFYRHHKPKGGTRTVREVVEEYLMRKESDDLRPRSLTDLRGTLNQLTKAFGDRPIAQVTGYDMDELLARWDNPTTRNNKRNHWNTLFNHALKRKYVAENPLAHIDGKRLKRDKAPVILKVNQVIRLMRHVEEAEPSMIPYFALCLFAGIRPEECQQLRWSNIDFDRKEITVTDATSKVHRQRYVTMSDNLIAWLLPHRKSSGSVFYTRGRFDKARGIHRDKSKSKPVVEWHHDIMRHSFGSYHYAMYKNQHETTEQMGNTPQILFKHYRRLVRGDDAEQFWSIMPQQAGQVLEFQAATQ